MSIRRGVDRRRSAPTAPCAWPRPPARRHASDPVEPLDISPWTSCHAASSARTDTTNNGFSCVLGRTTLTRKRKWISSRRSRTRLLCQPSPRPTQKSQRNERQQEGQVIPDRKLVPQHHVHGDETDE